jgi:predicted nucleic acid-binding protein
VTFDDLITGDPVFVDANSFVYYLGPDPILGPSCERLMRRIDTGDLQGFTGGHLVAEVAHKLMGIEASARFNWPASGMANRLRRHPAEVRQLVRFRQGVEDIAQSRVQVFDITLPLLVSATAISQQIGLLINDALIVAVMQANGLTKLASNDADFDRVPGITRYSPV